MIGCLCIAMRQDPPYNIILAATYDEPEEWLEKLSLPSHLLCYEYFEAVKAIEIECLKQLKNEGIDAERNKAFSAHAYEVINAYLLVRDNFYHNEIVKDNFDDDSEIVNPLPDKLDILNRKSEGLRLFSIGASYFFGTDDVEFGKNDVEQDYDQAFSWFCKGAELSDPLSQDLLGVMYAKGQGVEQNDNQAVFWFREAAEQGYGSGQFHLGVMYAKGQGVEQDYDQALSWFQKAAEEGENNCNGSRLKMVGLAINAVLGSN